MAARRGADAAHSVRSRVAARVAVLVLLLLAYKAFDWTVLRALVSDTVAAGLDALGVAMQATSLTGRPALLAEDAGLFLEVTANCTYADLALTLGVFAWRFGRSAGGNVLRLAVVAAGVFAVNVARLVLAVVLLTAGAPWLLAHSVPDIVIHVGAIAPSVWLALRADCADPRPGLHPVP
jgi:hypothetical protein